jgi:hypothetical protein
VTSSGGCAAASATLLIAAVVVTPYCGVLFDCGCTWPWDGLSDHCNVHEEHSEVHCPWCEHLTVGGGSICLAVIFGVVVALRGNARSSPLHSMPLTSGTISQNLRSLSADFTVRTARGVSAFLLVAGSLGYLIALLIGYPRFLVW